MTRTIMEPMPGPDKGRAVPGIAVASQTAASQTAHRLDRRVQLAGFLRRCRGRISPQDAGIPVRPGHRRTPGLRREELATLAGISVDWYIRLEQGRGDNPSPAVIDSLARALRLTGDERAHFYALGRPDLQLREDAAVERPDPSLVRLLGTLPPTTPAYILGRRWDLLRWNAGAAELFIDFSAHPPDRRNLVELTFLDPRLRARYADWEQVARGMLANFRAAAARHLRLPEVTQLIERLAASDPHFAQWWQLYEVAEKTTEVKRFTRPEGEPVPMRCDTVLSPTEPDQRLIVYTPA